MRSVAGTAVVVLALLVALGGSAASAGEPTVEAWAKQTDRVCKQLAKDNGKRLQRSLRLLEDRKFVKAGRLQKVVWRDARSAYRRIDRFQAPSGEKRDISRWLRGSDRAFALSTKSANALIDREPRRALRFIKRAGRADSKAQRQVRDLPIPSCLSS